MGMQSRRTNNFPESKRGLGHVTPTILAVRSAILATAWLLVYPRDAMLARVIAIATCLSVRPSVCLSVCHAPVLCQNEES